MIKVRGYESMGTHWKIEVWDELGEREFENLMREVIGMSENFDNKYSRFKKDSLVTKISKLTGTVEVGEVFVELLQLYFKINKITNGKINPCVGNTISDFGYNADYSLVKKDIIRLTPKLEEAVEIVSENRIKLNTNVLFDFGAIGKGYFVDKVVNFLKEKKLRKFLVDASGDIYYYNILDGDTYKCGLENPFNFQEVLGVTETKNSSLCSSGTNRRNWTQEGGENMNHYIDVDTLKSVNEIVATFVVAKDATTADLLSSSLFFVEPAVLLKEYEFEYLVINKNKQMQTNFSPGVLFLQAQN